MSRSCICPVFAFKAWGLHVRLLVRAQACASVRLAAYGPRPVEKLPWYLLPAAGVIAVSRVDIGKDRELRACQCEGDLKVTDLTAARGVVRRLAATRTGVSSDVFMQRARDAYMRVAGSHTALEPVKVNHAMRELAATTETDEETLLQMGPLLFRLLDACHDGTVTLREFLMGQALFLAAANASGATELSELCWRALDIDGNGMVTRQELGTAVDLMLHIGAMDPEDLQRMRLTRQAKRAAKEALGERWGYGSTRLEAANYYRSMYDIDGEENILRHEFMRLSALMENFFRLLRTESTHPIFLA